MGILSEFVTYMSHRIHQIPSRPSPKLPPCILLCSRLVGTMAQKTMKTMVKEEEVEGYILKDLPIPEPVGDEVLIKVDAVAICGSDIALYKWTPIAKVRYIFESML